jgi:hypothetical protein
MRRLLYLAIPIAACASAARPVTGPTTPEQTIPVIPTPATISVSDTIKPLATLSRGWNRIPGRPGTGCAFDSVYAFRVRPGLPDKVLILLNGGGACWRAQDCDPKGKPTYTMEADSANDASVRTGILDVANPANPVREFTMVFVPYCTGDMHLGTREVDYEVKGPGGATRTFAVRHGGAANVESVLDWVYANVKSPRLIYVAGLSTGALASAVYASKIARHYPRARVVQLGDAAGAIRSEMAPEILAGWGATDYLHDDPAFRSVDSADFTFERVYFWSGRAAPRVRYSQYNATEDLAQAAFLAQLGVKGMPVAKLLATNLEDLSDRLPWFRSFTAPGKTHTILRSNNFYTLTVGGVAFRDWLTGILDGDPVENAGLNLLQAPKKPVPKKK